MNLRINQWYNGQVMTYLSILPIQVFMLKEIGTKPHLALYESKTLLGALGLESAVLMLRGS